MRLSRLAVLIGLVVVGSVATAGKSQQNKVDLEALYAYFDGEYEVIGKRANGEIYHGRILISAEANRLNVVRDINAQQSKGIGKIEFSEMLENEPFLRIRFSERGKDYEITYLWQNDPDNYPRLSGYLYEAEKPPSSAGLEALFFIK